MLFRSLSAGLLALGAVLAAGLLAGLLAGFLAGLEALATGLDLGAVRADLATGLAVALVLGLAFTCGLLTFLTLHTRVEAGLIGAPMRCGARILLSSNTVPSPEEKYLWVIQCQ